MKDIDIKIKGIFDSSNQSTWESVKFGDIAKNISERVEPQKTDAEVYVGLEHLDAGSIHIRRFGTPADVKGTKLRVYKGDIIFGKRRAYQRKAAIAEFDGICSAHAMVLRANPENIDANFFPFFLHSNAFMNRALEVSEGSLSPTIKWKTLEKQEFKIPPRSVQEKLSEILWKIDHLENSYADIIEKCFVSLQSIFLEKYIDKKSKEINLDEIAFINPLLTKEESGVKSEVDFIPMESVSEDGELSITQKKDFQKSKGSLTNFKNGDVIFAKITPCMENGKGAVIEGLFSPVGLGSTEFHVLRPKESSDLYYIYYLTKLPFFRKLAERHMTGSAGQKRVPTDFLKKYKFRAPSKEARKQLGVLCHTLWQEKKSYERQLETTRSLRVSILNAIT